jgi:tyrosyl-tRNA synthetase
VSPPPLPQIVDGNPCYEYVAYIVFPWFGKFEVSRNEKNGGNVTYTDLEQLKADYTSGALHPGA